MEHHCSVCAAAMADTGNRLVCPVCLARLQRALHSLPRLYVELHLALPHPVRRGTLEAVDRTPWKNRGCPPPLRMSLLAHAEQCVTLLRAWSAQSLPDAMPDAPMRPGPLLQHLCRHLAQALPANIATPLTASTPAGSGAPTTAPVACSARTNSPAVSPPPAPAAI